VCVHIYVSQKPSNAAPGTRSRPRSRACRASAAAALDREQKPAGMWSNHQSMYTMSQLAHLKVSSHLPARSCSPEPVHAPEHLPEAAHQGLLAQDLTTVTRPHNGFTQGAPGWLSCLVQWAVREQLAAGAPITSGCILPAAGTASARSAATPPSVGRIVAARTWPQEAQLPSPDFRQVFRADVAPPHAVGTSAICCGRLYLE